MKDASVGTNPMFTYIEQCEGLKKFCQKFHNKGEQEEPAKGEKKEEQKKTGTTELEKALAKGSLVEANTKDDKPATTNQKKKKNAKKSKEDSSENFIDFGIIKKFTNLKLTVPIKPEDLPKSITDLDQLREALIFWGKII